MSENSQRSLKAGKSVFDRVDCIGKPERVNHSFEKAAIGHKKPAASAQAIATPEYDRNRPDDIWYFRR